MDTSSHSVPHTPAEIDSLPVRHFQAAGIDVGDRTHWVCVGNSPEQVREFPAHTAGLRDLIKWLLFECLLQPTLLQVPRELNSAGAADDRVTTAVDRG